MRMALGRSVRPTKSDGAEPQAQGGTPLPALRGALTWITQDWTVNAGHPDSQLVLLTFRTAQWVYARGGLPGRAACLVYKLYTSLFLGVDIPYQSTIGPRLRVYHPHGIVLNPGVTMGADCVLRHNVTIGNTVRSDGTQKGVATVGDDCQFGAGCVVVGPIHVGDHARIGALALVTVDVPERGVMLGNPAQLVRINDVRRDVQTPGGAA